MRKYFQVVGLMLCVGLCSGCGPKPGAPADSEFTGKELEGATEAQEAVGIEDTSPDPNPPAQ